MKRLAASILLVAPSVCFAMSGNELHSFCSAATGTSTRTMCDAYVLGAVDGHASGFEFSLAYAAFQQAKAAGRPFTESEMGAAADKFADARHGFCVGGGVTKQQLVDIVAKYLRDNPEWRHLDAATLTRTALALAYPLDRCSSR